MLSVTLEKIRPPRFHHHHTTIPTPRPPTPPLMIFIIQMFQLGGCLIQGLEGRIYGVLLALLSNLCSSCWGVASAEGFCSNSQSTATYPQEGIGTLLSPEPATGLKLRVVSLLEEVDMWINYSREE